MPGKTGNKKAIMLLADGKLAFAYTCKPHAKLAKKFQLDPATTGNWVTTEIARDPVVVVVNPSCGVTNLSVDQLKAVFSGQVANWKEVGGADLPVVTAYLDDTVESGIVTVFKEVTVGAKSSLAADAKRFPSPSQLGHLVASEAGAVTFMGLNTYSDGYGQIVSVAGGEAEQFLEFVFSARGAALIEEMMVSVPRVDGPPL